LGLEAIAGVVGFALFGLAAVELVALVALDVLFEAVGPFVLDEVRLAVVGVPGLGFGLSDLTGLPLLEEPGECRVVDPGLWAFGV
jgi:hypothetical protein